MKKVLILAGILILLFFVFQSIPGEQKSAIPKQKDVIPKQKQPSRVARQSPSQQKYICLTFDDGPDSVYTPQVLEILKKHKASATFFFLGKNIKNHPDLVRRVITNGCEIGIHSYEHRPLTNLTLFQVQSQINKTYQLLNNIADYKPVLFRPPFGFINNKVLAAAREKGLKVVLWSRQADPKDFKNPGVDVIVKIVVNHAEPGFIVLLHDRGGHRMQTVEAVDKIIKQLSSKGYRFVTVSTLLKDPKFQDSVRQ